MYVIQHRIKNYGKWDTYPTRYPTIKEAQAALTEMPRIAQIGCRIAEEYTVVRYKAAKVG